jgi:hypothetical protein
MDYQTDRRALEDNNSDEPNSREEKVDELAEGSLVENQDNVLDNSEDGDYSQSTSDENDMDSEDEKGLWLVKRRKTLTTSTNSST